MIFRKKSARIKELEKKICKVKHQLEIEHNRVMTELEARQKVEMQLWKREHELKRVHYYERQIKDVVRQDYWTRIFPIFFMDEQELRMIVRNDLIYHDQTWNYWKVIEGYCSSCGKITEYRTFQTEKDALCYAASKQVFDMAPISTICNQCYYTQYIDCA